MRPLIKYRTTPNFRVLCPTHPYGTDPSSPNPAANPPLKRRTLDIGHWSTDGGPKLGRVASDVGSQVAQIQVAYVVGDQSIESGESLVRVGPYEIRPWVDYTPTDNDAGATATALAAALDNLQGFSALAVGDTVTIASRNLLDRIPVETRNRDFAHLSVVLDDLGYLLRVDAAGAVRHQVPALT
jgi:hypothetical protein